ncbi:hypothetical protein M0D21_21845 [Aquimarina sp. D1M17]|uniref:hypothetical protein n=1 Tax=Aquimarina acroporae TaxID=2937283 RepID=UPI0020BF87A8|nr:hypothetical protein [Aquimarina acroporae]MCK8524237.1 hypothetical protein [Aquimarina acroporae]
MFRKLPRKILTQDYESISDTLENDGIVVFEDLPDNFSKFKQSFDDYQKTRFENEIKYLSGSYNIDKTKLHYYRNPEKLSKNYAKRLLESL